MNHAPEQRSDDDADEAIIRRHLDGERPAGASVMWNPDDANTARPNDWGTERDPWMTRIQSELLGDAARRALGVTTSEVLALFGIATNTSPADPRAQSARVHCGLCLRALGWAPRAQTTIGGRKQARRYYPTAATRGLSGSLPPSVHGQFTATNAPPSGPVAGKLPELRDPRTWRTLQKSAIQGEPDWVEHPVSRQVMRRPLAYVPNQRLYALVERRNELLQALAGVDRAIAGLQGQR